MADVWANSMACHPRATCHTAGCCHLVNSLSRFQNHMPHCRVQSPGAINVMIVPHCRVKEFHPLYWKSYSPYFIFLFLMQFRLWRAAAFVSSPIYLFLLGLLPSWSVWCMSSVRHMLVLRRNMLRTNIKKLQFIHHWTAIKLQKTEVDNVHHEIA